MSTDPFLVTTDWLEAHLGDPDLRVVDIRGSVTTKQIEPGVEEATYRGAPQEYETSHIPGSVFVDWTIDIADLDNPVPAQIAPPEKFAEAMSVRGIGPETRVIAVDHMGGQFATRLWWALKYYGHDLVSVLDGGWNRWVSEERPIDSEVVAPVRAEFVCKVRPKLMSSAAEVLARLGEAGLQLIDARDAGQFTAAKRRGPRGGHIPGAMHVPRELFFDPNGGFLPLEAIQAKLGELGLHTDQPVIGYCNGGVAATVPLFHMARLGFKDLTIYDGSWNEWGTRQDLPIES